MSTHPILWWVGLSEVKMANKWESVTGRTSELQWEQGKEHRLVMAKVVEKVTELVVVMVQVTERVMVSTLVLGWVLLWEVATGIELGFVMD